MASVPSLGQTNLNLIRTGDSRVTGSDFNIGLWTDSLVNGSL